MTCTGLNFCQHKPHLFQSPMFSLTDTQGAPRAAAQTPEFDHGSQMPRLVQDETSQSCSCHEKQTDFFCAGATELPKLLAVPTTLASIFGTWGSVGSVSCRFDGALGARRDPRIFALCTELSLCQKNVPLSLHEWCLLWYYHVFHQMRFGSHSLRKYVQRNAWVVDRVKGYDGSLHSLCWSPSSEHGLHPSERGILQNLSLSGRLNITKLHLQRKTYSETNR